MRLNNSDRQFKPGAVRGKRQWIVFGVMLGIVAALAINSNTRRVVRREITTGLPIARSMDDPVERIEFAGRGNVNNEALVAAARIAASSKTDVPLQIACTLFKDLANATHSLSSTSQMARVFNSINGEYSSLIESLMQPIRERDLREMCRMHPNSPEANAAYIRQMMSSGVINDRYECYWFNGNPAPDEVQNKQTGDQVISGTTDVGTPSQSYVSGRVGQITAKDRAAAKVEQQRRLGEIEEACLNGMHCDPQNAFFSVMLAFAEYIGHNDTEAIRDVRISAESANYNDYSFELARGWQRLDESLNGVPDPNTEVARFESGIDYRCIMSARNVGQITIWKAIELEHNGRYEEGVALRMRIARIGAAMSKYRPRGLYNGTIVNLVYLSAMGPGATRIQPYTNENTPQSGSEPPYEYAYRCSTAYLAYLDTHGFTKEADWYRPIFKAQYKQASKESYIASSFNANPDNLASHLQPELFHASAYWILAQISFVILVGIVMGFAGFRRRFAPQQEIFWTRSQWGAALGGCLIASFCLTACSILYSSDSGWPLAAGVLAAVGLIQIIVRRSTFADTPVALLVHSLCLGVCLLIAAGISAGPISSMLGAYRQSNGYGTEATPFLSSTMPFGLAMLVIPALVLSAVVIVCRVRYQGVPSGLFRGSRRAIVPLLSALLALWAVNIVLTAGVEKDLRQNLCENLGLKPEAVFK